MNNKGSGLVIVLIVVLLLVIVGAIVWMYYAQHVKNPSSSGDCGVDMSCFIANAKTCASSRVEFNGTSTDGNSEATAFQLQLSIKGVNSQGKCSFSSTLSSIQTTMTAQGIATSKSQGFTDVQIQAMQAQLTSEDQFDTGLTESCLLNSTDLVQLLISNNFTPTDLIENKNCTSG